MWCLKNTFWSWQIAKHWLCVCGHVLMRPFQKHVNYPGVNGTEHVWELCLVVTLILRLMFFLLWYREAFLAHPQDPQTTCDSLVLGKVNQRTMICVSMETVNMAMPTGLHFLMDATESPRSHTFTCQLSVQVTVHVRLCGLEVIMRLSIKTDHDLSKRQDEKRESDREGEIETERWNVWTQWAWRVK